MKRTARGMRAPALAAAILLSAAPAFAASYWYRHAMPAGPVPADPAKPDPVEPSRCALPWGGEIAHGESATAYREATAYGTACVSETRTCDDGALGGSFLHDSCTTSQPEPGSCYNRTVQWGGTLCVGTVAYIPHGQTATVKHGGDPAYYGEALLSCNNGVPKFVAGGSYCNKVGAQ